MQMTLSDTIGKPIGAFCSNGFTGDEHNHCAHFVAHVLGLDLGYDCKAYTRKPNPGASIRVQELFAACPAIGVFVDAPNAPCLAFVTAKSNVDLAAHTMRNVPQKHVGIYDGVSIYHYSNSTRQVLCQSPEEFFARFRAAYRGEQALYFGVFPPGARIPGGNERQPAAPAVLASLAERPTVTIRSEAAPRQARDYFATVAGGAEFLVGRSFTYGRYTGIFQPSRKVFGPVFRAADHEDAYGPVAAILGVIAAGESAGYFNRINTYDRAACTYGFFQLAAHTPGDNLILLFRRLASESEEFQRHFPDLAVRDGRLHRRIGNDHFVSMEKETPRPGKPSEPILSDFMAYLNPGSDGVEEAEVETAARLIALAEDATMRALQVNVAAEITMRKMRSRYDAWYRLDGASDRVCAAIADIHHQGRGTKTAVRAALKVGNEAAQVEALCAIGAEKYASRCATLRKEIRKATAAGTLGRSAYDRASGLFRPAGGWEG